MYTYLTTDSIMPFLRRSTYAGSINTRYLCMYAAVPWNYGPRRYTNARSAKLFSYLARFLSGGLKSKIKILKRLEFFSNYHARLESRKETVAFSLNPRSLRRVAVAPLCLVFTSFDGFLNENTLQTMKPPMCDTMSRNGRALH